MTVIPTGFAQANFIYNGASAPTGAEWTLGLGISSYGGSPITLGEDLVSAYETANFDASTSTDVDLSGVLVKFGPDATGPSALFSAAVGGAADQDAVPNVSYLIHKVTSLGGRAGRGRAYFPGVPEAQTEPNGTLDSTWRDNFQAAWDTFLTELTGLSVIPVVLHAADSPLTTPTAITSFVVDARAATQRRRLRR